MWAGNAGRVAPGRAPEARREGDVNRMNARTENAEKPRLVVGLTGGTGAAYGVRLLETLRAAHVETHVVMCRCARGSIGRETGRDPDAVLGLGDRTYHETNQAARISSGSFVTAGMIVAPCSTRSLASIASGYANNLIHRAADVTIKEGRRLVLVVGEPELGAIDLDNLARMSLVPGVAVSRASWDGGAAMDATIADALDLFGIDGGPVAP